MRRQRRALDKKISRKAAYQLALRLRKLDCIKQAKTIAVYAASDEEISLSFFINWVLSQPNKKLYLPCIAPGNSLVFRRFTQRTKLKSNIYGLHEPEANAKTIDIRNLDLALVPLLGFDKKGHRLGMGGGYYDRTFCRRQKPIKKHKTKMVHATKTIRKRSAQNLKTTKLIGIAFAQQQVTRVPLESWDLSMNIIATEHNIFRC